MAEVIFGTQCEAQVYPSYTELGNVQYCLKCAEMELHLRKVGEELSSVHIIVSMLNEKRTQLTTKTASLDGTQTDQEIHGTWEEMTRKSSMERYEAISTKKRITKFKRTISCKHKPIYTPRY
jgi:glutaredoxin-related protein